MNACTCTCTGVVPDHLLKDVDVDEAKVLRCKIITELEEENQLKTEEIIKIREINRTMT